MAQQQDPKTHFIASLKGSPFFESLSERGLAYLAAQTRLKSYPAGATIFAEGDPSQGLYWLQDGTLKAVKFSTAGREQIIHLIEPGQTFNEVGSFSSLPNPASVIALEDAQIWHIPRAAIRRLIEQDPNFAQSLIDVLSFRLRHSVDLIEDLSLYPLTTRLARLILEEAQGDTLFRPAWYTQNELAARLGSVTDVVQRALRKLENDGLITVERGQIRILDREGLQTLAS